MARISVRDRLFLLTTLSGAVFLATQLTCATLDFRQLTAPTATATALKVVPSFHDQRGFFSVLRWAENLHTPQDLALLVRMVRQSTLAAKTGATDQPSDDDGASNRSDHISLDHSASSKFFGASRNARGSGSGNNGSDDPFHVQLAVIAAFELYVHASKLLLQCGLVIFLHQRLKMLSRRRAMSTICLCALVLLCWKMAQTCLREIFASRKPQHKAAAAAAAASSESDDHTLEMRAAFLNTLFLLRFTSTALVNLVLGRAYQLYFCPPWPESWRRIPRYLGSKNLVVATLFYAAACVAAMSISCAALRSLSEAALHFESAALLCSLLHFVFFRFAPKAAKPKLA